MPRRRVERDLHDGAQPRLVPIALHVRAAGAKLPAESSWEPLSRVLAERSTRSSTAARLVSLVTSEEGSLGLRAERWDIRERRARSILAKLGATRVLTQARRR